MSALLAVSLCTNSKGTFFIAILRFFKKKCFFLTKKIVFFYHLMLKKNMILMHFQEKTL